MIKLPSNWTMATVDDTGDYINGMAFKPTDWSEDGTPIIRIQNLTSADKPLNRTKIDIEPRYRVAPGDILVSWSATLDVFIWDREPAALNQHIFRIVPKHEVVNRKFLFHSLRAIVSQMAAGEHLHGSTMKHINRGPFLAHDFPLPPYLEQKRIVARIDRLSARSQRAYNELERVQKLVKRARQSILKIAFMGSMTRDLRSSTVLTGWQHRQLHEVANIQTGITLGKKRNVNENLVSRPYLRVANVQRGWLNLEDIKNVEVTASEAERLRLLPGDILMNEGGDRDKLGRGWIWHGQIPDCIHQNHVFRVRLHDKNYPSELISLFANEFGQKHFIDEGKQTTNLASISKAKLATLPLILPPKEEAAELLGRIRRAFAAIDRLAAEAQSAQDRLRGLDQAILAKAFRGELVPQDPNDEPASVLLDRIRAERAAAGPGPRRGRRPRAAAGA